MGVVLDNKCPGCGANIKFNPETQNWHCEYCNGTFKLEDFQKNIDVDTVKKGQDNINEYSCPNCGAVVVTDENTVSTACIYCGNTTIMKNRLQGIFQPDKIIPFKTKKEDAIQEFKNNVKKRWFAPKDFYKEENIKKISGVYIPFWLYDSYMNGEISARAERIRSWSSGNYRYTETRVYNCIRGGELGITDLPVDGSTKFQDEIMDSIEPFDYSEFKPFHKSYLSGFLAEKYDLDKNAVYTRAEERMKNTMVNQLRSTINGYSSVIVNNSNINIKNGQVEYALLPVWMLNLKYKDKMYTFAMNGQTKKVTGYVPIDVKKVIKKSLIFFIICFIIMFIISFVSKSGVNI